MFEFKSSPSPLCSLSSSVSPIGTRFKRDLLSRVGGFDDSVLPVWIFTLDDLCKYINFAAAQIYRYLLPETMSDEALAAYHQVVFFEIICAFGTEDLMKLFMTADLGTQTQGIGHTETWRSDIRPWA